MQQTPQWILNATGGSAAAAEVGLDVSPVLMGCSPFTAAHSLLPIPASTGSIDDHVSSLRDEFVS
jgi:hypothetical protein